jgi:hypothetical protein
MAKALLISRNDVVKFTSVNGNVDVDKFIQYVSIAQDIHIQGMLGTKLLEKIQAEIIAGTLADPYLSLLTTYIKPCLIHASMLEYLPFAAITIGNKGVYKHGAENSETVSKDEIDFLIERERKTYDHYKERFIDYICQNNNLFPEYNANTGADMNSNTFNNFAGWVL